MKVNKCKQCSKDLSLTRKSSSKYCSDTCYKSAARIRSNERYKKVIEPYNELLKNDQVLKNLYPLFETKKKLFFSDLDDLKFNWGISKNEVADKKGNIWKVLIDYAYRLDSTKQVFLWKLK
jgi:hypothetical protein